MYTKFDKSFLRELVNFLRGKIIHRRMLRLHDEFWTGRTRDDTLLLETLL